MQKSPAVYTWHDAAVSVSGGLESGNYRQFGYWVVPGSQAPFERPVLNRDWGVFISGLLRPPGVIPDCRDEPYAREALRSADLQPV